MDEPDRAPQAILDAVARAPGLTLCCLGPLTNIAHALQLAPELRDALGPVYIMGGSVAVRGTQTRWSEFNWWADPEAADVVLRADLDVRLVPLDVTRRIAVPGSAIRDLLSAGERDETARFWGDALRFYADFHRSYESFDGCVVNDALAVALVADPSLVGWREMRIAVSLTDDDRRGAIIVDAPEGALAHVALEVKARDVLALIGQRVFTPWLAHDALLPGAADAERWLAANPLREERG